VIVFYNPHIDDFLAEPVQFRILGRRALKKYGFMFEQAIISNCKIRIFCDATMSAVCPTFIFRRLPKVLRSLLCFFEVRLWVKLNKLSDHVVFVNELQISKFNDTLLAFSYKAAVGLFDERLTGFKRFKFVVFHLSHYFISTSLKSENMEKLDNIFLAADSDFRDNLYFKSYFSWYKKAFLVLPFAVSGRFNAQQEFESRSDKIVATGSFHDLEKEPNSYLYRDFIQAFKIDTYHPLRKEIYYSREELEGVINTKISPYRDYAQSRLGRFIGFFNIAQKSYFSIDLVDLYNGHKLAVVGEEVSGAPALGALEAMACGCVLIASPQYLAGLGLEEGRHYLPYDGSLADLLLLKDGLDWESLDKISKAGTQIILEEFSELAVHGKWIQCLNSIEREL
tara:strand:- start:101 stop:1285 length:1185 start_codon:yes stop_codon:yes gene_type:complete